MKTRLASSDLDRRRYSSSILTRRSQDLTLESIADAILALDLAERRELDSLVDDLYRLAADDETLISTPRMVQAWGQQPAALR